MNMKTRIPAISLSTLLALFGVGLFLVDVAAPRPTITLGVRVMLRYLVALVGTLGAPMHLCARAPVRVVHHSPDQPAPRRRESDCTKGAHAWTHEAVGAFWLSSCSRCCA